MPRKRKTASGISLGTRVGRNIKIARTRQGMTQSELAEALNLESATVSRIETGTQLPSIDRLEEIAAALNVSLTALVADTEKASAYAEMLADVMAGLSLRDREFVYRFALTFAQHVRQPKKK